MNPPKYGILNILVGRTIATIRGGWNNIKNFREILKIDGEEIGIPEHHK